MNQGDLEPLNTSDLLAKAARSTVGIAPFVGPLLSELVTSLIPNQRVDRLSKFVASLERRLSVFEKQAIRQTLDDEEAVALVEDGFIHASRATTDSRREYLASVVARGLGAEQIAISEVRYLLNLLGELNDIEVIWLRSYLNPTIGGDEEYRLKHESVLDPIPATLGSGETELEKSALQKSYKAHLHRLGLISPHYKLDSKTKQPEFDNKGVQKISYWSVSILGKALLRLIGLTENEA